MLAAEYSSTRKFRLIYLRAIVPPIQNLQRKNTRIDQPKFLTHFVNKYQKILKHVTTNIILYLPQTFLTTSESEVCLLQVQIESRHFYMKENTDLNFPGMVRAFTRSSETS